MTPLRRTLLTVLGLGVFAAGPLSSGGCSAGFDPPGKVDSLRILSVVASNPYPQPGESVTFDMTYYDGREGGPEPAQITWIGGCFSPEGDQYFACFDQLQDVFEGVAAGTTSPIGLIQQGVDLTSFTIDIPQDIISRRPPPQSGPYYGTAFVFFAVCSGEVRPVPAENTETGGFPLGCFDRDTGARLGPESFIPGYAQLFSFDDGRTNRNPVVTGLELGDGPAAEGSFTEVAGCDVSEDDRRLGGCGTESAFDACEPLRVKVVYPEQIEIDGEIVDNTEIDPGDGAEGEALSEVVWVRYFADGGDFDSDTKLIHDAVEGRQDGFEAEWVPPALDPPEPGQEANVTFNIWAVVYDNRGGQALIRRDVTVARPSP